MIDTRHIFVDADACPVKEEVYKVAFRHEVRVSIVSNMMMRVPVHPLVTRIVVGSGFDAADRSEEHTSELQSLMRISYAVFCLKKKKKLSKKIQKNQKTRVPNLQNS